MAVKYYTPTKLSENIKETPEGFLICFGVPIARTGMMEYGKDETPLKVGSNGIVKIYRDAKEVFRPETIASFEGKDVTIKHPEEFVDPENYTILTKGVAQNIRKASEKDADGEECLLADLLIKDGFAIKLVKNGLREVSCGYEAEYEQTGDGEGRQFNIVGNHIALVEQGRAGSSYAINDEKGKVIMDKLLEKLKKKFGVTVVDEMMKDESEKKEAIDRGMYDELVKMVKDLGEKLDGMGKSKDEGEEKKDKEKSKDDEKKEDEKSRDDMKASEDEDEAKDDDGEILERLKALEAAVAKMLESEKSEDEDEEESQDEYGSEDEDSEESEDEDEEESKSKKVGDEAARAEILSPGIKKTKGKDLKAVALEAAYQTKDGKEVIHSLTDGKKPDFKSKEKVSALFIAASEILKSKRGTGLEKTKDAQSFDAFDSKNEVMTAEKMNELNERHYQARK